MANRFTRGILDGSIESVADLKSAFKTEAKRTHPDLADVAGTEDFIRLRNEYERALKELSRGGKATSAAAAEDSDGSAQRETDLGSAGADDPYAALSLLLKRGFPKSPRHRKESLRYNYARLRARSALGALDPALPESFGAMEKELIDSEYSDPRATETLRRLLSDYLKAKRMRSASLAAAVRMECARTFPPVSLARETADEARGEVSDSPRPGPAAAAFFRALLAH